MKVQMRAMRLVGLVGLMGLMVLAVLVDTASGQSTATQLQVGSPAPPPVGTAGWGYTGQRAGADIYYWIITRYPAGSSQSYGPVRVVNTVGSQNLNASNFVVISWQGMGQFGATGYDVIRADTPNYPLDSSGSCGSCAVVVNTAALSATDTGGGLSYTQPAAAPAVTGTITVDNISNSSPFMRLMLGSSNLRLVTSTGNGMAGQVPVYNADGVTTTPANTSSFGASIGGTVSGGTAGSVLFVGAGPVLAQNNANLFWNNASGFFGVNTTANPTTELDVRGRFTIAPIGTAPESYPSMVNTTRPVTAGQHITMTRSGLTAWSMGYVPNTDVWGLGPANATDSSFSPSVRLDSLRFSIMSGINMRLEPRVADPGTPSDGDIWYNSTDNEFKCRQNGATVPCISPSGTIEVGSTTVVSGTANAFLFTDPFGILGNAGSHNMNPTTNVVGFGTNTALSPLHVRGNTAQASVSRFDATGQPDASVYTPFDIFASAQATPTVYSSILRVNNIFAAGSPSYTQLQVPTGTTLRIGVGAGADFFNVFSNQVAINTVTPNASAILQLDSTTRGFLPPRMTTVERTGIASPAEGLQVYDTDLDQNCTYTTAWNCSAPSGATVSTPYLVIGGTSYYMPQMEPATLPSGVSFSWVNQGTATEANQNGSLVMSAPNNNGGLRLRSTPLVISTNYTIAFQCVVPGNTAVGECGVGFREASSGRIELALVTCNFGTNFGCRLALNQYTSAVAVPSTVNNNGGNVSPSSTVIIRISFDGTNRSYNYCLNHSYCSNYDLRTAFFTTAPDEVVWGRPASNMTGSLVGFMHLLSWRTI